ncbi:MAG: TatD family hydrolase [Crocinitomicaceae bacterium]
MYLDCHTHRNFNGINSIVNLRDSNQEHHNFYYSYGFHPWEIEVSQGSWDKFELYLQDRKCLALGEIGLDKLKGPKLEVQTSRLYKQLEVNQTYNLPVIIHCVKSWNELNKIARTFKNFKWVFHGFNKVSILDEILKEGWMISVGASILNNEKLQNAIQTIPDEQLLLETDDKEMDIFEIYQKISKIKKISLSELEGIITNNFKSTFKKWLIG